jgi:hypothetical protein
MASNGAQSRLSSETGSTASQYIPVRATSPAAAASASSLPACAIQSSL